jgi:polar amino acid transport system substrate-binding protein
MLYFAKAIKYIGVHRRYTYMNKVQITVVGILGAVSLASCGTTTIPSTWDEIVDRGYVIVGLDDTFAPMGFRNQANELVGFDVDLAKLVFEELDIEVRFQPIDWAAKVLELDAGNIDMIWNGLTITEPRRLEMLFSDAYIANRQIVMTKASATINTIAELADLTVAAQSGSASEDVVKANPIFEELELVTTDTFNLALLELDAGNIDAVVVDEIYGRYVIAQNPGKYRVMSEDFGDETFGIGFRLGITTIRDIVNDTLFDLIESGDALVISETWFSEDVFLTRGS